MLSTLLALLPLAQDPLDDTRFFLERVRPVLAEHCFECHGPEVRRAKGGLRLDGAASLALGGVSGPAVDAEHPEEGLLLKAIRREDPDQAMPPEQPLPEAALAVLEDWVARGAPWATEASAEVGPEERRFFEERVRPLLAERCFGCHGPELDEVESELRMSGREGLLSGGLHGPALVPGDPEASLLMRAVRYTDRHLRMPPESPLDEAAVLDLERWIAMGAPWPDYAGPSASAHADPLDIAGARERWPFTELVRPAVPAAPEGASAIDAFVRARLAEAGLEPSPPATEAELVRRVYHDLLGLPPSYDELEAYLADARPDRWERLVDELLARPEYGERWARRWLDLVRYAQTNGFERDAEKPYAWRYRDWVVDAFNADMPYSRFVKLQLAGDELENSPAEGLVATGFYRLGAWDAEPDDPVQAEFDELDDVVRVIGEGLLGLTLSCARCHDHEFDPIAQEDYYAMLANLRGLRRMEQAAFWPDSSMVRPLSAGQQDLASWRAALRERRDSLRRELDDTRRGAYRADVEERFHGQEQLIRALLIAPEDRTQRQHAQVAEVADEIPSQQELLARMEPVKRRRAMHALIELEQLETSFEGQLEWVLSVRETLPTPDTQLLVRGRASSPGELVQPGYPAVACPDETAARPTLIPAPAESGSSGRRTALANWITSPRNPLSPRVIANRVWQHLFGEGIVRTPNDFGAQGAPPTHPELLDWLASELIAQRGSLKSLQREILLSSTYRQSSRTRPAQALELDPSNELLWRQNPRRLEAEAVRDALLLRAGELASGSPGRGYFPALGRETLASMYRAGEGWERARVESPQPRSLYLYAKREVRPPLIEMFDGASDALPVGRRNVTTTATQSLVLLHGEFVNRRAMALARRIAGEAGEAHNERVRRAFELVLARAPDAEELALCSDYLESQASSASEQPAELTLRPAVPGRLAESYLVQLEGADMVHGPQAGWRYLLGRWSAPYNATLGPDPQRGPAALSLDAPHDDVRVRAELRLDPGCESFGLALRAGAAGEELTGVELCLEPMNGVAALVSHGHRTSARLAEVAVALEPDRRHVLEVALVGNTTSVSLDGVALPALSLALDDAPAAGQLGLRVLGEGVSLRTLSLGAGEERPRELVPAPAQSPADLALESLVLLLFNLNEFVYVD